MREQIEWAIKPKKTIKRPFQLTLFVTDHCNARCGHCFHWQSLNKNEGGLNLNELNDLSKELGQLLTLNISGGEPFLREDISALYGLFADQNSIKEFAVPTNGLLPNRIQDHVRKILSQHKQSGIIVSLSLDGLEDMHDRIRGVPGNFKKLKGTYDALVELKKEFPNSSLLIKIGTVLCNWNIKQIPDLIKWVQSELPEVDFQNFEIMRGTPLADQLGPPTIEELEWVKPYIFEAWNKFSFYGKQSHFKSWLALGLKRFVFTMYLEIIRQKKQLIPCFAAHTSAVVDEKGNLYFCELRESIGNLRETTFNELWHSKKAEELRLSIERGDCYCVHSCFQQKNVFLNPRLWPYVMQYLFTGKFQLPNPSHINPVATTSDGYETFA